jgi:hypothetical protein
MNLKERIIHWHRLFGLTLCDLFSYTPYHVELEKDLTLKQQFLDVVIIAQNHADSFDCRTLPDGLDNLFSFPSATWECRIDRVAVSTNQAI